MEPLVVELDPTIWKNRKDSRVVTITEPQTATLRICVKGFGGSGTVELRRAVRGIEESTVVASLAAEAFLNPRQERCHETRVELRRGFTGVTLPGDYFLRAVGSVGLNGLRGELEYEPSADVPGGDTGGSGDTGGTPGGGSGSGSGGGGTGGGDTGSPPGYGSGTRPGGDTDTGGGMDGTTELPPGLWDRLSPTGKAVVVGGGAALLAGLVALVGRGRGDRGRGE